jgi:nucleolar protein 56
MHGKVARALADKLSIAVKIDYFKGKFIGDKLKKGLVDKFKIQY